MQIPNLTMVDFGYNTCFIVEEEDKLRYSTATGVLLALLVMCIAISPAYSQNNNRPDPLRIYRRIVQYSKVPFSEQRDWRIRWLEIWETHNGQQEEWVIVDYKAYQTEVLARCYHSVSNGGTGKSIIEMPEELIPVQSAETLWAGSPRVSTEVAIASMEALNCDSGDYSDVNGYEAQHCPMPPKVDAAGFITELRGNATSMGDLWVTRGGFPVRYLYQAEGETVQIFQKYEAFSVEESALPAFEPVREVGLYCFPDGFPRPENAAPMVEGNLTFAAFESVQTIDELRRFYDSTLPPDWTIFETGENTVRYERQLPNNNSCRATLEFYDTGTSTMFSVDVLPARLEGLEVPKGLESVVQAAAPGVEIVTEDPTAVLDAYLAEQATEGWAARPELTFRTEASAFAVLQNGDQQQYIMLERVEGDRVQRVQGDLPGICGPTFAAP